MAVTLIEQGSAVYQGCYLLLDFYVGRLVYLLFRETLRENPYIVVLIEIYTVSLIKFLKTHALHSLAKGRPHDLTTI